MKTRKLVLIVADVVLLAVCLVQFILSARDTTKYFTFKDEPDSLEIVTPQETISLYKEGEDWFIGEKKYPASMSMVDSYISAIKNIRALDKVGSIANGNNVERYELTDSKKTIVTAKLGDKVLRTIEIGKTAVSSSQCYMTVDGGKDIYLVSGGVNDTFDTSVAAARTTIVLNLNSNEITGVAITDAEDKTWSLSRMGDGDDVVWNVSGGEIELDEGKANVWLTSFASLSTRDWYAEDAVLEGTRAVSARITYNLKDIKLEFFALPKNNEKDLQQYYGTCSETPYRFKVDEKTVKQYLKPLEELAK
ncbi:MAG: DUF4340 domain-containing protein [Treponema sp.]|nr:DUF4340 domain-containing protein [Spirochaetia bacterium]MDD7534839.1 DUF4340 domain-containing protein [Treponema sp.]MDY5758212.1 DUF4340 domain-containing protein [Treponema sp.]MDY5818654.1 DUF4340 domain-containing protein [Treponema sp.]